MRGWAPLLFLLLQCGCFCYSFDPFGGGGRASGMLSPFAGSAIVSTKACGAGPNATVCYSRALGINSQLDRNLAVSTVLANDPNLYWNGRRVNVGASVMFDFPGVYVRFVVESTTIVAITVHDIVRQRYLAVLDGVEIGFFVTASTSTATYSVLSNLDVNSTYTVEIWKVTEAAAETNNSNPQPTTVQSLSFSAGASLLPPPQPSSLQLEWVGDSITTGYGAMYPANGTACDTFFDAESVYHSYGAQICRALGAECRFTAWSGRGLQWNSDGSGAPNLMGNIFSRTLGSNLNMGYNFSSWVPNAVFINIGENDFGNITTVPAENAWTSVMTNFISTVREAYSLSDTLIIVSCGPLQNLVPFGPTRYCGEAQAAVQAQQSPNVIFVDMRISTPMHGCHEHANTADNAIITSLVLPTLRSFLVVTPSPSPSASESPSPTGVPSSDGNAGSGSGSRPSASDTPSATASESVGSSSSSSPSPVSGVASHKPFSVVVLAAGLVCGLLLVIGLFIGAVVWDRMKGKKNERETVVSIGEEVETASVPSRARSSSGGSDDSRQHVPMLADHPHTIGFGGSSDDGTPRGSRLRRYDVIDGGVFALAPSSALLHARAARRAVPNSFVSVKPPHELPRSLPGGLGNRPSRASDTFDAISIHSLGQLSSSSGLVLQSAPGGCEENPCLDADGGVVCSGEDGWDAAVPIPVQLVPKSPKKRRISSRASRAGSKSSNRSALSAVSARGHGRRDSNSSVSAPASALTGSSGDENPSAQEQARVSSGQDDGWDNVLDSPPGMITDKLPSFERGDDGDVGEDGWDVVIEEGQRGEEGGFGNTAEDGWDGVINGDGGYSPSLKPSSSSSASTLAPLHSIVTGDSESISSPVYPRAFICDGGIVGRSLGSTLNSNASAITGEPTPLPPPRLPPLSPRRTLMNRLRKKPVTSLTVLTVPGVHPPQ